MPNQSQSSAVHDKVLATDLDGTLIPLDGNSENLESLERLAQASQDERLEIVFVTGRHLSSVEDAIARFGLPTPQWIICDVGTSIYQRDSSGGYQLVSAYHDYQAEIVRSHPMEKLRESLGQTAGLRLQEDEKQGRFKLSFYAEARELDRHVAKLQATLETCQAPYSIIHSVDPFNGDGLVDLLPKSISKAQALRWWVDSIGVEHEAVVFAGDSGNDLAAFESGYRSIVVGNADRALARRVHQTFEKNQWTNRLYLARGEATSGVLEGCCWFGLIDL